MGQEHPLIAALDRASDGEESYADQLVAAAGGDPNWRAEASWKKLATQNNPDHMEITEEAVKCYRLDQDNDIVDNRVYVGGEGRPTASRMLNIQSQVEAERDKPVPGIRSQDVEIIFSSFFGVALGLIAVGILLYYALNLSFLNNIYDVYKSLSDVDDDYVRSDGTHVARTIEKKYSTIWNWWVELYTRWFC